MRGAAAIAIALCCLLCACGGGTSFKSIAHSADSLSGAVNVAQQQLQQCDTIALTKALARYNDYKEFSVQHLRDTLSKAEANALQHFLSAGKQLQVFAANRPLLLNRVSLQAKQLQSLAHDAAGKSGDKELLQNYLVKEQRELTTSMSLVNQQLQLFQGALAEFKASLSGVEALLRKRNAGELPLIVKDAQPL